MAFALGTATGRIEIEYDGSGIDKAKEDVDGLQKSSGKGLDGLNTLGNTASVAGLAIAAGLGVGANAAADFEQRMSAISAVTGASGVDMDRLRDKALQLGKDTAFSATEAGLAIEELAKAGLPVEDILNGAADATVALAAAGEIALPEAATIASNAMNQFNLSAKDMNNVADMFAGAANASAIGVTDLGQALQQVGAVANLSGVSLEDTTAAIALMGNAGIAGSDAGTSLKSMFMRLNPSTKKATDTFKELGIMTKDGTNAFYDAQGNMKSLSDIAGILSNSLKGMTAEQKQAYLQTMFGSDAIRAAAILTDAGAKGFDKMATSMGKVSAADVAAERMDNFKGSLEEMKGSLETAGIAVGSIMLPFLRQLVDAITDLANWFLNLSDTQQKWIVSIVGIVGALLVAFGAIAKFVIFLNTLKTAFVALRAAAVPAWLATLGPIALVIAAVAAVIAIIVLLWKNSETFRDIITGVWNAVKSAAAAVGAWFAGPFKDFFINAWNAIKSGMSTLGAFFAAVWNGIKAVASAVWGAIVAVIRTYINMVMTVIRTGLNILKAIWGAVWRTFGPLLKAVWNLIVAIVRLGWTIIKGLFLTWLNVLKAIFRAAWNAITAILRGAWNIIKSVVMAGVNVVRSVVTSVWNAIRSVTSAIWNGIKAIISGVWGVIGGTVSRATNNVKSTIIGAWDAVSSATRRAWDALVDTISNAVDNAVDAVSNLKNRITGFFSGAASWLYNAGRDIIQGLINGISSMIDAVTSKINSITDRVAKFLPGSPVREGPLRVLNRGYAGKQIVEMLADGMDSATSSLEGTVADVAGMLPTGLTTPTGAIPQPATATGVRTGLRMVSGRLTLDPSGRAFIRGIAEEVVDESDEFDDSLGRM